MDSFSTGIFPDAPSSPFFNASAAFRISNHTKNLHVVPLPGAGGLLVRALSALVLRRRSKSLTARA